MTVVEAIVRDECKHLISPPESCVSCFPRRAAPEPPRRLGPWFRARFPGECAECGDDFDEGDVIRADGSGDYLCGECGAARAPELRPSREELELW